MPDPQKAASVQAMLADIFGEHCRHFLSKEIIYWSQSNDFTIWDDEKELSVI